MTDDKLTYFQIRKDWADYQKFVENMTLELADTIQYGVSNLSSEAGEVAGAWAKYLRDSDSKVFHKMYTELGDCLFMVTHLCNQFGFELEDVMRGNVQKLQGRRERDTITGSGDDR